MSDTVIRVENLSKHYRLGAIGSNTLRDDVNRLVARLRGQPDPTLKIGQRSNVPTLEPSNDLWALRDVSFEVKQGEVVGIIGRNGAGKSTLLKILSRITAPTSGQVKVKGRIASLLEVGTGFHPELTGRENIYLNGAILGMKRAEIARKFDEIVDFSGVEQFIDTPVKRYSSGMGVRLAFAVAAHLEPEILLVDEVLAVGDIAFQKKSTSKMKEVSQTGRTVLTVSHNMGLISRISSRVIWLDKGICKRDGSVAETITSYESGAQSLSIDAAERIVRNSGPKSQAWIAWAEIRDDAENPRMIFRAGEYMTIRIRICGVVPPHTYFEWVLFTEKDHPATSGGTFFKAQNFVLPTQSGLVSARIGPIPLAEGRYRLLLRLGEQPGYELLDVWEDAATISISDNIPEPGGLPFDHRRGVIYIPAFYSISNCPKIT